MRQLSHKTKPSFNKFLLLPFFLLLSLSLSTLFLSVNLSLAAKVYRIGITQIVDHPELNQVRESFLKEMAKLGYEEGKNIRYDYQNAQGQISLTQAIAKKFISNKVNLIVAISTPSAQAAANLTKTIPIVFGAVTDPVQAGIAKSFDSSGRNVTGVSDEYPIEKQIDLMFRIKPDIKSVGVPFNPSEPNSVSSMVQIKKALQERNIPLITVPVFSTNDVFPAAISLVGRVDAIFTGGDFTVANAIEAVVQACKKEKIPFFVSNPDGVKRGGIATLGLSYEQVGIKTAQIADEALKGKNPRDIPIQKITHFRVFVNLKSAKEMGVELPESILGKAIIVDEPSNK